MLRAIRRHFAIAKARKAYDAIRAEYRDALERGDTRRKGEVHKRLIPAANALLKAEAI